MSGPKNIIGLRFGRLVPLAQDGRNRHGHVRWLCMCYCGEMKIVLAGGLLSGRTRSCGCLVGFKHGLSKKPLYNCYWNILQRCFNKKNKEYKNYGGRGITICKSWLNDVVVFYNDVINEIGERPKGMSLDRINNDGNYEPGNVRWATPYQQTINRTVTHRKEFYSPKGRVSFLK